MTAVFDAVTRPIGAHDAVTRQFRAVVAGRPRLPLRQRPRGRASLGRLGRLALMQGCQLAALAAYVTGVYLAVAVGLGALTSWSPDWRTAMRLAAVAVTAAGFTTVRRRVGVATRRRLAPAPSRYEVLASLASRLRDAGPIEEALPSLARLLGEGTEAREAAVWLTSGPGFVRVARWTRLAQPGGPSPDRAGDLGRRDDIDVFATVRDSGDLLGALSVALPPGRSPAPPDIRLVSDLANAAGSLLRSTLLTAELSERVRTVSRQAKELHSSRRRLVVARDIARRRLAHELAVTVQATLIAVGQAMTGVQARLQDAAGDTDRQRQAARQAGAVISAAQAQAAALVARFRSVVHGIYPPALSDYGLVTAIEGLADSLPRPTRIAGRGLGRYPAPLESAVYFCAAVVLRALASAEHAVPLRLALAESGTSLVLTIIDDTRAGELRSDERSLLEEMSDHADAHGGTASATEIGGSLWLQADFPLDPPAASRPSPPPGPRTATGAGQASETDCPQQADSLGQASRPSRTSHAGQTGHLSQTDSPGQTGRAGQASRTGLASGASQASRTDPADRLRQADSLNGAGHPGRADSPSRVGADGAGVGRRGWRRLAGPAFWAGFAAYSAFTAAWLGLGLVTAIAADLPAAQNLASRLAGGEHPAWISDVAAGVLAGMPASYPPGEVVLDYAFSALNIAIAVVLLRLARRNWTVRLLAVGMTGSAGAFNLQAHSDIDAVQRMAGLGIGWWPSLVLHGLGGVAYVFALLLFPGGRARAAGWSRWAGGTLAFVGVAGAIVLLSDSTARYPHTVSFVVFFGLLTPVAGITAQWRNYAAAATPEARQQSSILLRALVLAFGAAVLLSTGGVVVRAAGVPGFTSDSEFLVFWLFRAVFAVIPIALMAGVLRFRLWDVERLFSRALVYGLLALLIGLLYVSLVVGTDIELNLPMQQNPLVQVGATAAVVLALAPARMGLTRLADRLAYGRRPPPDQVLARLSALSRATVSGVAVLPSLARVVGDSLGARSCEVRLARPGGQPEISSWQAGDPGGSPAARPGPAAGRAGGAVGLSVPVVHRGAAVGEIRVEPPAGGLAPGQRLLLAHLADGAGPVLHNQQLALELEQRLGVISEQADRIAASRRRIAAAQVHERRVLERNLHDGAQPQLTSVSLALGLAAHRASAVASGGLHGSPGAGLDGEPGETDDLAAVLAGIVTRVDDASASLSEIARGLYPARLREDGLRAALEAHASALPGRIGLEFRDGTGGARFAADVEAAVCFACLEALQNALRHAPGAAVWLILARTGGALRFTVADAGPGMDASTAAGFGRQGMEDRMAAVGGSLAVRSQPGEGTVVTGWVPAEPVREVVPEAVLA